MLTKKENLFETIRGGRPDRFVNQFSFLAFVSNPIRSNAGCFLNPGESGYDGWGVKYLYPENTPRTFPDCKGENRVLPDITQWKKYVKAPQLLYPEEEWAPYVQQEAALDRREVFPTVWIAPGIFERLHSLMGMEDTLINFYEEPEAVFHHDDWGSQRSTFLSPEMFEEFLEPAYKKIYGYWKENGVKIIVHHSDSYGATLVPSMIRMGIHIWQGPVTENNLPEVIQKYGDKLTLMGGLNNGVYDREDCTQEKIREGLQKLIEGCGSRYLIPALTMGGPESIVPGVYDMVSQEVERMSKVYFREQRARHPHLCGHSAIAGGC
ncbi:MAG: uroporphyrinogen decarboxylase [Lachnospiraceae bacterium]|jgi:hypothetical protein|nr:uroporphyrinogen decarboxylase [Lachnospiraceae bacterium]MCI8996889.1 uroporphyrinogen decarboxylase [Lachnospiraceae bacterium]